MIHKSELDFHAILPAGVTEVDGTEDVPLGRAWTEKGNGGFEGVSGLRSLAPVLLLSDELVGMEKKFVFGHMV